MWFRVSRSPPGFRPPTPQPHPNLQCRRGHSCCNALGGPTREESSRISTWVGKGGRATHSTTTTQALLQRSNTPFNHSYHAQRSCRTELRACAWKALEVQWHLGSTAFLPRNMPTTQHSYSAPRTALLPQETPEITEQLHLHCTQGSRASRRSPRGAAPLGEEEGVGVYQALVESS